MAGLGSFLDFLRGKQQQSKDGGKPRPVLKPRPTATVPRNVIAPLHEQLHDIGNPAPAATTAVTPNPADILLQPAAPLPDLPTYQGHDKHSFGERVQAFFRGGREGGLGGAIEGARNPGAYEYQDWLRTKYAPALAQRQQIAGEQTAEQDRKIKSVQALAAMETALAAKKKAETEAQQPFDKGEIIMMPDGKGGFVPMTIDGSNVRHSTVATAATNQAGQLKTQQERNKGTLAVEEKRGQNNLTVEKERTGRARYVADQNYRGRVTSTAMTQAGQNYRNNNSTDKAAQEQEAEKQAALNAFDNAIRLSNGDKDSDVIQEAIKNLQKYSDIEIGVGAGGWPYAKRISKAPTASGKAFPAARLDQYAKEHNASPEQARRYLEAMGYTIQ